MTQYVRLLGNSGEPIDWNVSQNIIDTTNLYPAPSWCKRVVVHQEFPAEQFFWTSPPKEKRIRQYLNCFNETPWYEIWHQYKAKMLDFEWRMHGLNGDDGFITPTSKLAESMRDSQFIWHIKRHGEGFGHIIHNAFAVGRPIITIKSYYQGKLAYPLLQDGITCLDLENRTEKENIERIRYFSQPEQLLGLSLNCRSRFETMVDFDADFKKVKLFLETILKKPVRS